MSRLSIVLCFTLTITALGTRLPSRVPVATLVPADPTSPPVGGFSPANISDPDVLSAASFGWAKLSEDSSSGVNLTSAEELKLVSAEKQVVEGLNYRLVLKGEFDDKDYKYVVVIYRDLEGNLKLVSWQKLESDKEGKVSKTPADRLVSKAAKYVWKIVSSISGYNPSKSKKHMNIQSSKFDGKEIILELSGSFSGEENVRVSAVARLGRWKKFVIKSFKIDRQAEQTMLSSAVGGWQPADIADLNVIFAGNFAWKTVGSILYGNTDIGEPEILQAQSQDLSGTNYKLTLRGVLNKKTTIFSVVVFRSLSGGLSLSSFMAVPAFQTLRLRDGISFVGGYQTVDVASPDVVDAANAAWPSVDGLSNNAFTIIAASKQVVAGVNYKLELITNSNGNAVQVTIVVWHKPDGSYEVTNVTIH